MGISKNLPLQHNKQLVTVDYCVSGSSSIDENTVWYSGIYTTTDKNIDKLKQIFESKDFSKYCSLVGKDMNGGYISISSKMIKEYGINK